MFFTIRLDQFCRSCWALGQSYTQMPRDLFNAAFVSCWTELSQQHQNELVKSLEQALRVPDLPEITQTILNLAEFMEHCEKGPLPLDPQLLGQRAMQCRAYAKALHYKEAEFHESPTSQVKQMNGKYVTFQRFITYIVYFCFVGQKSNRVVNSASPEIVCE